MTKTRRGRVPQDFRTYLLNGDHWRTGRRLQAAAPAVWTGVAMHRGYSDPTAWTTAWESHLEQVVTEQRNEGREKLMGVRHERVRAAMAAVAEDRPEEGEALAYFVLPLERRRSVSAQAGLMGVGESTLYELRDRAIAMVWDELGGVW